MIGAPKENRTRLLHQQGAVVWLTGLPGAGKTTIATALEEQLLQRGHLAYVLDGDVFRKQMSSDLTFSAADRSENIRRAGEVAALLADAGAIALLAFVSPYRSDRKRARQAMPPGRFFEIFIDTPLPVCEGRDPKGMYKKARAGLLPDFTGVSAPYEAPENPELVLKTVEMPLEQCTQLILTLLLDAGILLR